MSKISYITKLTSMFKISYASKITRMSKRTYTPKNELYKNKAVVRTRKLQQIEAYLDLNNILQSPNL